VASVLFAVIGAGTRSTGSPAVTDIP
jgi:hypothetical protein